MKNLIGVIICCMSFYYTSAQQAVEPAQEAAEPTAQNYTLRERFTIMKSKSNSYNTYKVIKETVLDGVWKIVQDSIRAKELAIQQAKQNINQLQAKVGELENTMKAKDESMQALVFDSTHIKVLGIDMTKSFFVSFVGILFALLVLGLLAVIARIKMMNKTVREKTLAVTMVTSEYEEYKRRAMEKQTKLSRELQDERNRLGEIRRN